MTTFINVIVHRINCMSSMTAYINQFLSPRICVCTPWWLEETPLTFHNEKSCLTFTDVKRPILYSVYFWCPLKITNKILECKKYICEVGTMLLYATQSRFNQTSQSLIIEECNIIYCPLPKCEIHYLFKINFNGFV